MEGQQSALTVQYEARIKDVELQLSAQREEAAETLVARNAAGAADVDRTEAKVGRCRLQSDKI